MLQVKVYGCPVLSVFSDKLHVKTGTYNGVRHSGLASLLRKGLPPIIKELKIESLHIV